MTRNINQSSLAKFIPALFAAATFILVSLQATAGASGQIIAASAIWRGPVATRTFSAEQVSSYALVIEASGDQADVYYPQPQQGQKWLYLDQFPVVLMSQGAMVDKEYYSLLAISVARQGFIVVVPNQRNSALSNSIRYAEMSTINEVLAQMRAEDMSPESPVYGITDPNRLALMGHSFGGASSIFAVADFCQFPFCDPSVGFDRPAELKAAVLVSSNSGTLDLDTTGIPVAIVGGSLESGRSNQQRTYQTLEPPKAFITVEGATHYGMCDADVPPGARAKDDEPVQAVPQAITASRYGYWAGVFLRAHVHNDVQAARLIYNPVPAEGITVISQQR